MHASCKLQCRKLSLGINIAGRVTDDIIRSLLIAQELLQTKEIVLMHHTGALALPSPCLLERAGHGTAGVGTGQSSPEVRAGKLQSSGVAWPQVRPREGLTQHLHTAKVLRRLMCPVCRLRSPVRNQEARPVSGDCAEEAGEAPDALGNGAWCTVLRAESQKHLSAHEVHLAGCQRPALFRIVLQSIGNCALSRLELFCREYLVLYGLCCTDSLQYSKQSRLVSHQSPHIF